MELAIGLPLTNDLCHSTFLDSFVRMRKPAFTYLRPRLPCAAPIDKVRNSLAAQAMESGCTHLLMMDTDQSYPPDTIEQLLCHAARGLDIVCAKVHRRYPPFDPLLLKHSEGDSQFLYETMSIHEWHNKDLVEVDATGCGCMLINMSVFDRIRPPWFEFRADELPDGQLRLVGEDVSFCEKAKAAGIRIFVDASIKVGHIAAMMVTEETHFIHCKLQELANKRSKDL